jgi:hypothetical protein
VPAWLHPIAIGRAISLPLSPSSGHLGRITAYSQQRPSLAHEAKDRLRESVEGFFFRRLRTEDGKRIGRLLVKSPPGLRNTRQAIERAIR